MSYDELIEWLYIRFPSFQKTGNMDLKMGLEKINLLCDALGRPERKYPTIHVAGTNGKGSCSSMLASALAQNGYKVGLYTSPHLLDFRERMKVVTADGWDMISRDEVEAFLLKWRQFFLDNDISFFEITTGMAFDWFAAQNVDIAVIEVGLGGRLDATNVITPKMSVITNISLEHCQYLGNTLEAIAGEKAGIIKPGVPVVIGEALPETRPVFERVSRAMGSSIAFAEDSARNLDLLSEMDLQGDYQRRNLNTVLASLEVLSALLPLDAKCCAEGIRHAATATGLRGRWETLRQANGTKSQIICDTGHNAHAFRWLREQVDSISCNYDYIFFIFGVVADKDLDKLAQYLPHDVNYIFTAPSTGRALPAAELSGRLAEIGITGQVAPTMAEALELAEKQATGKDLIFIAGSNYLIADLLQLAY